MCCRVHFVLQMHFVLQDALCTAGCTLHSRVHFVSQGALCAITGSVTLERDIWRLWINATPTPLCPGSSQGLRVFAGSQGLHRVPRSSQGPQVFTGSQGLQIWLVTTQLTTLGPQIQPGPSESRPLGTTTVSGWGRSWLSQNRQNGAWEQTSLRTTPAIVQ